MKILIPLILFFTLMPLSAATEHPITTAAKASTATIKSGETVLISIEVKNTGETKLLFPQNIKIDEKWMIDGSGVDFSKDESDIPISRFSIDSSPPVIKWINAGETKTLLISWTATVADNGVGFLLIALPLGFEPLKPIPLTITK